MMDPRVAIILVNYREYAGKYLNECYKSLLHQTYKKFDLFIVDNQSDKATRSTLKSLAPTAKIIPNIKNLGWAGGNDIVIKSHLVDYDYFVLLNMDTYLDPTWLKQLISYVKTENKDIVQSKILVYDKDTINSLGNRINYLGYGYCNGYGERDGTCKAPNHIDYVSGASMLVRKEVFEKIGFFREEFFMYHDDLEFCWRARLAGFTLGIAEKSICYHKYSFNSTMNLIYYMERNRLVTLLGLLSWPSLLLILPILIPFELAMIIYLGLQGRLKEKLRAIKYLFTKSGYELIYKIRQEVKTYRILKDRDIVKNFSGIIEFSEINNWLLEKFANPVLNLYWKIVRRLIIW